MKTIMAQMGVDDRIYIATDTPDSYHGMKSVNVIPLSNESIAEMRGKHDFFWRIKIVLIQKIAMMHPGESVMYLDGDTYLFGSLSKIKQKLAKGIGMMHVKEGCPGDMKGKSHDMWDTVNGKTYCGITISTKDKMWNAGVVAIPGEDAIKVTTAALEICDGMLEDGSEPIVVEQYSLSIATNHLLRHMEEAKKHIGHYWHNKYHWARYIAHFLIDSYTEKRSIEDELQTIRNTNLKMVEKKLEMKRVIYKIIGKNKNKKG